MLVVLSPAKKLSIEGEKPNDFTLPEFTNESQKLIKVLTKYSPKKLQGLMKISDAIAELNVQRYNDWNVEHDFSDTKQAALTFTGEVYNGLDAASFSDKDIAYAQDHLRILSGLYGVLKPMDLIHAYRLEMGTRLKVGENNNLYEFWKSIVAKNINETLKAQASPSSSTSSVCLCLMMPRLLSHCNVQQPQSLSACVLLLLSPLMLEYAYAHMYVAMTHNLWHAHTHTHTRSVCAMH